MFSQLQLNSWSNIFGNTSNLVDCFATGRFRLKVNWLFQRFPGTVVQVEYSNYAWSRETSFFFHRCLPILEWEPPNLFNACLLQLFPSNSIQHHAWTSYHPFFVNNKNRFQFWKWRLLNVPSKVPKSSFICCHQKISRQPPPIFLDDGAGMALQVASLGYSVR